MKDNLRLKKLAGMLKETKQNTYGELLFENF